MYARAGAGPPAIVTFVEERLDGLGNRVVLGNADAADRAARLGRSQGGERRLLVADALEHRVGAEAVGQLANALDRLVAALADDVGRAELLRRARSGPGGGRAG